MAMGWVDENGSWNWNETRSDINSLPREVSSNVRGVHACVNAKVAEYKASGLNWESCQSTFTRGERRSINHFLRLVRKEKQGKQCFQRWNRYVRFKVVRLLSSIPWDSRHAEQLLSMLKPNCL